MKNVPALLVLSTCVLGGCTDQMLTNAGSEGCGNLVGRRRRPGRYRRPQAAASRPPYGTWRQSGGSRLAAPCAVPPGYEADRHRPIPRPWRRDADALAVCPPELPPPAGRCAMSGPDLSAQADRTPRAGEGLAWALAVSPLAVAVVLLALFLLGSVDDVRALTVLSLAASAALVIADRRSIVRSGRAAGGPPPSVRWFLVPPVYLWRRAACLGRSRVQVSGPGRPAPPWRSPSG